MDQNGKKHVRSIQKFFEFQDTPAVAAKHRAYRACERQVLGLSEESPIGKFLTTIKGKAPKAWGDRLSNE